MCFMNSGKLSKEKPVIKVYHTKKGNSSCFQGQSWVGNEPHNKKGKRIFLQGGHFIGENRWMALGNENYVSPLSLLFFQRFQAESIEYYLPYVEPINFDVHFHHSSSVLA